MAWWDDIAKAGDGAKAWWGNQTASNNPVTRQLGIVPQPQAPQTPKQPFNTPDTFTSGGPITSFNSTNATPTPGSIPALIQSILKQQGQQVGDAKKNWDDMSMNLNERGDTITKNIDAGYGDLQKYLTGSGDQERKDINTQFNNAQSANTTDLQNRGLGNTTVLSGTGAGIERQRADALGGLNQRINDQQLGFGQNRIGAVSGQENANLSNRSGLATTGQTNNNNAVMNYLQNQYSMGKVPFQQDQQNTQMLLNFMGQRSDPYPDSSGLTNAFNSFAAGLAPAYKAPKDNSILGGLAGGLTNGVSNVAGTYGGIKLAGL